MPIQPIQITNLPGYFPHIESRAFDRPVVMDGRNFAWNAAGPYSAFASRLLVDTTAVESSPSVTQSLVFDDETFIATLNHIRKIVAGAWTTVHTFSTIANPFTLGINVLKWTYGYLGSQKYICNPTRGIFRIDAGPALTDISGLSGMPASPISICETNGRMCYLNATTFTWSGPNNAEDLTPAVGGAGFQTLAARIGGAPYAMTRISNGAIVWTTEGALLCEFIGGNNVFRFDVIRVKARPLNAFAIEEVADGTHVYASRLGIYRIGLSAETQELTPEFNVFLREQWRSLPDTEPALFYSMDEGHLYVSLRDSTAYFNNTFVLNVSLDKWGKFSTSHLGIFAYESGRGKVAYTSSSGIVHRFLPALFQGRDKEGVSGYDGLDSFIEIGFIRAPGLVDSADTMQELQELMVFLQGGIEVTTVDEGQVSAGQTSAIDEGLVTETENTFYDESVEEVLQARAPYGVEIHTDAQAVDEAGSFIVIPELAQSNYRSDLWTCMSMANYHKIRLTATEPGEYYHARHLTATVGYVGQQA